MPQMPRGFDKKLKAKLASRRHEIDNSSGIKKLALRIRVEFWAWAETIKEIKTEANSTE